MSPNPRSVLPEETVPCKVSYQRRQYTDIIWGAVNFLAYVAFLATGLAVVGRSHNRHAILSDGTRGLGDHYMEDAKTCCALNGNYGYVCDLYERTVNDSGRRLSTTTGSKFDGDEGIFDAFIEAPELIIGLLSIVLAVSILWAVLLRFFAKPVVVIVELLKIAGVITVGVYQDVLETRIICFVGAGLMCGYVAWQWKNILFAAKMIKHSTISLKENPSILVGSLFMKVLYAGNAALFVLFFAKSFDVVDIGTYGGTYCDFEYPQYVWNLSIFWGLSYLWTVLLFEQMRLSVIATIVGSWHFHPEDRPGVFVAIKNIATSYGTISVTSLIATIAEWVNRKLSRPAWSNWVSPLICFTWPMECCFCCLGSCIHQCIRMFTSFAVVLHTFTGENFINSAKNSFKILSRHFERGFVTDITSRSLFSIASHAFSFCVALITWVWIDARFDCGSMSVWTDSNYGGNSNLLLILQFLAILFALYYPVLGLYVLILLNRVLRQFEKEKLTGQYYQNDPAEPTNHFWIPPLAGTFVGCLAMMFFSFMSNMFNDIVTTLFLCFAIDKDNNVDMNGSEFEALVKEMPDYKEYKGEQADGAVDPEIPVAEPVSRL